MSQSGLVDPKISRRREMHLDICDQVVNLEEEWVKPIDI
jgi:hypothetical protein